MNSHSIVRISVVTLTSAVLLFAGSTVAAPPVQVDLATPSEGEQATTQLEVTIDGNGFDNGSQAIFFKTGTTDTGGVTVTNTEFLSKRRLRATIDIAETADIDDYDIEVQTLSGRRGKGHTLFAVIAQPSPGGGNSDHAEEVPLCVTVLNAGFEELTSDGAGAYCDGPESIAILEAFEGSLRFRPTGGSKKNPSDRTAYSDADGCNDRACDYVQIEALSTERQHMWVGGEYHSSLTLALWDMYPGQVSRIEGRILIDKFRAFRFSTPNSDRIICPTNLSAPMWIRCDGKVGSSPDTSCDQWTLSSFDLVPDDAGDGAGDAGACLINDQRGDVIDEITELDFTLMICARDESC